MSEILILVDGILFNATGLFFVALGLLILIRHTGFPDLTVDGSFTFGAAVFAAVIVRSDSLILALAACIAAGLVAGAATAVINQWLGVTKIVASVVSMTIFVLLSPYLAEGATIGLLQVDPVLSALRQFDKTLTDSFGISGYSLHFTQIALWGALGLISAVAVYRIMRSAIGTRLRYTGSAENPFIVSRRSIPYYTVFGLMMGNCLVAVGGGIEAVRRGAFTANMGLGTILVALTILVLGESLLKIWLKRDHLHLGEQMLAVFLGLLVYSVLLQGILRLGINTVDLKLMTTLLLLVVLAFAGRFFPNSSRLF